MEIPDGLKAVEKRDFCWKKIKLDALVTWGASASEGVL